MRNASKLLFGLIICITIVFSCAKDKDGIVNDPYVLEEEVDLTSVYELPPSPQRTGDPIAGKDYLITGDYVSSGVPFAVFKTAFPDHLDNELNRTGDNATVTPEFNIVTHKNGAKLAVLNCLQCHGAKLNGEYIIGLGSTSTDYTSDLSTQVGFLDAAIRSRHGMNSKEWRAYLPFRNSTEILGPRILTEVVGVNPAIKLTAVLAAHRNQDDLSWSQDALMPIPHQTIPSDIPAWWHLKRKSTMFYNGMGQGDLTRIMMASALLTMGDTTEAREVDNKFNDVYAFLQSIEPPEYPKSIDIAKAAEGKFVYRDNCAYCHGSYGENEYYPNFLVPNDVIQTDPWLAKSYFEMDGFLDWYNDGFENIGTDNTGQQLEYIIIEDAVLLIEGDINNLPPTGTEEPSPLPLNGSTYHLIAQQEPGAPGPNWISLGTMGCANGTSSSLTEFPQFAGDPFNLIYCNMVVGSYDPNDKQAIPSGFGDEHSILPNTDIDYTIRFQNTGTDTAFRVVITDQLSPLLDPATIEPGPSSHPYEFRLEDQGLLSFTFHNIELPDSNTNLIGSQGFVTFKIAQRPLLPSGTLIENNANIYFDFNSPILTNTTFHTVNNLIDIVSGSVSVVNPQIQVKVMPNPMQSGAWIQLEGQSSEESILFQLFDTTGKKVRQLNGNGNNIWLNRSGLPSGMYFFTILKQGTWQASGKLIVN